MTAEDQVPKIELLTWTDDEYGGVIVEMDKPMDSATLLSTLRASISHWKQLGKKGVWIKLPIYLVSLVEALVKEGFWYHHAEPKYLMLVYWIPDSADTIPANATHRVGVGSFVVNEKQEVLVVQEKSGHFQGSGAWKFPTGVVDQGEDICAAAVREVKEETGVDAEFLEVLAFRQSHMSFFEKSDLFFVCLLRPLSSDIQVQEVEIEAAKWMPFDEYAAQPIMEKYELMKYINDIYSAKIDGQYSGFTPVSTASNFSKKNIYLYLNAGGLKKRNSFETRCIMFMHHSIWFGKGKRKEYPKHTELHMDRILKNLKISSLLHFHSGAIQKRPVNTKLQTTRNYQIIDAFPLESF